MLASITVSRQMQADLSVVCFDSRHVTVIPHADLPHRIFAHVIMRRVMTSLTTMPTFRILVLRLLP
jgi:predicted ATPase